MTLFLCPKAGEPLRWTNAYEVKNVDGLRSLLEALVLGDRRGVFNEAPTGELRVVQYAVVDERRCWVLVLRLDARRSRLLGWLSGDMGLHRLDDACVLAGVRTGPRAHVDLADDGGDLTTVAAVTLDEDGKVSARVDLTRDCPADLEALLDLAEALEGQEWEARDYSARPEGSPGVVCEAWETFVVPPGSVIPAVARFVAGVSPAVLVRLLSRLAKAELETRDRHDDGC